MLANVERAYLAMLRVAVLFLATIALFATIGGLIAVVPYVRTSMGPTDVQDATLGEYVRTRSSPGAETPEIVTDNGNAPAEMVPTDINDAAADLTRYLNRGAGQYELNSVEDWLLGMHSSVPMEYRSKYSQSLRILCTSLEQSKGVPLDIDGVSELLDWHHAKFDQAIAAAEAEAERTQSEAWIGLGVAGGAFLIFMATVFCFLFVKIERNLRAISTRSNAVLESHHD